MATAPFSTDFIAKLKEATAWRFNSQLGPVFTPRFFCCDDPNSLGITAGKNPVAVLSLSPKPALVSENVTFDGTDSYDPDGSIASYAWTFESGTPATSALGTSTVTWAAAGEYEVTLVVTDGTGLKSSPARTKITIWDLSGSYYLCTEAGVYFTDDGGQTWTAKNTGLAGDALKVNHLVIDPATKHLSESEKVLWIATDGGIYYSTGAASWTQANPASLTNTWDDAIAPTVADLEFVRLLFAEGVLFAVANWQNAGGDERSWVFYSEDSANVRESGDPVTWGEITLEHSSP